MRDAIKGLYEMAFRDKFQESFEDEFQDFFSDIMERVHPEGDFVRVRPWGNEGDRKNDGYLFSTRTVFAVYAPRNPTAARIVGKINSDFSGCLPHWEQYIDSWVFVHNDREGLAPVALKAILDINEAHEADFARSWSRIDLQKRAMRLGPDDLKSLFPQVPTYEDFLEVGMEQIQPVLDHLARTTSAAPVDLRPVPHDKIEYNLLSTATADLIRLGMTTAQSVRDYYQRVSDELKRDQTAQAFTEKYNDLRTAGLGPDDIYWELKKWIAGTASSNSGREVAIYGVLSYFFEECDIFLRPDRGVVA